MNDAVQEPVMLPSLWKRAYDLCRMLFCVRVAEPCYAGVADTRLLHSVTTAGRWSAEALVTEIRALRRPAHPGASPLVWDVTRQTAAAFARKLHATLGHQVPRPRISAAPDGGVCFTWVPAVTKSEWLVELVFFRRAIEYAVVDGLDTSVADDHLLDGETSNAGVVLREVVKRYVVGQ